MPGDARAAVATLVLSHFRSHRAVRIEAGDASVALYGPNGAGKTNVLEALSLLSPGRGLRRAAIDDIARSPGRVGWRVEAEVATDAGPVAIETAWRPDKGRSRSVRIDDKNTSQAELGRTLRLLWLTPVMDRLWLEGAADRRAFLDRITLSFEPSHGEHVLAYERAMRERNRLLKEPPWDPGWVAVLEARMAEEGAALSLSRARAAALVMDAQIDAKTLFPKAEIAILGAMESSFAEVIRSAPGQPVDIADAIGSFRAELAENRTRDASAGRTLSGPHRSDLQAIFATKGVEARFCSTGEQKALLISLVLANARALTEGAGPAPVLLLDEVAAHLDNDRRRALYDEVFDLGLQVWMTGTGAELFDDLDGSARKFEVRDEGDGSIVAPI